MSALDAPVTAPATGGPRSPRTLGFVGVLYVTQFIGVGFITVGLAAILREDGIDLETLAAVQLVGLIWPLKFVWAPLVDRVGWSRTGHYRGWLLLLQLGMVVSLLALLPLDDPAAQVGPIAAVCGAFVFFSATQDIAADAVCIRLLRSGQRAVGNGVQVGASYLGNILGGGLCVVVYDVAGWQAAVLLLAGLTAGALAAVWWFREEPRRDVPPRAGALRSVVSVFAQPGCRTWAFVVVPLLQLGASGAYALASPMLVDAGWSLSRIGAVTGLVVSVPAVLTALGAGVLVARHGRVVVLAGGAALLAGGTGLLAPIALGQAPWGGAVAVLSVFMAGYTVVAVVIYTVNMDFSRPATAGSDFTVLVSFSMVCSFVAAALALSLADAAGYVAVLPVAAAAVLAGAVTGARQLLRSRDVA